MSTRWLGLRPWAPPPGRRGRIPGAGKPRSSPHRYDSPCALSSWRWTWPAPPNSSAAALGLDHSRSLEENLTPLYRWYPPPHYWGSCWHCGQTWSLRLLQKPPRYPNSKAKSCFDSQINFSPKTLSTTTTTTPPISQNLGTAQTASKNLELSKPASSLQRFFAKSCLKLLKIVNPRDDGSVV